MPPIKIEPGFSPWLASYLLAIHLAALLLIPLLQPQLLLGISLILLICFSLGYYWKRDILRYTDHGIDYAEWNAGKGWSIRLSEGELQHATLTPSSFLNRYLVALQFTTVKNSTHRLLLPADALQPDLHRRVRILLRMEDHFGE
ncbi:MAG: hypothetical protein GY814_16275 [Gammaproteobacteria bacterium]|nr:hypothetical protein [Gammaproteobacteria bacterium]MCP4993668.1 hypothetical protein [Gammaproteobacteria bacterium]